MNKDNCQDYEKSRELFFEALRKKVQKAEDCFYKLGFKKIIPNLRKRQVSIEDAEDLLHEGMALFFFRLNTLRVDASPTTILYKIVHNKWVDKIRATKRVESLSENLSIESSDKHPEEAMLDIEMQQEIRKLINQLTPSSKLLIDLVYFEEKTPSEIANLLNMTQESIYNKKSKVIKHLRDNMKGGKKI